MIRKNDDEMDDIVRENKKFMLKELKSIEKAISAELF